MQRVVDAIAREGVDHEPLLVRGDHFLRGVLQVEDALVDIDHAVDQRDLEVQPRLGDDAHRLAEPDHEREPGLVDREQRAVGDDGHDDGENGENAAGDTELHWVPPVVGARRSISFSGRIGTTLPPFAAALLVGIEDDLVGAAEHPLHRLEIDALAGDLRRLLVFLVDLG